MSEDAGAPSRGPADYCREAAELVAGERARTHGDALEVHVNLATAWNWWLRRRGLLAPGGGLQAHDAAMMMLLLKVVRTMGGSHNPDDYRDIIGYAALAGHLADVRDAAMHDTAEEKRDA